MGLFAIVNRCRHGRSAGDGGTTSSPDAAAVVCGRAFAVTTVLAALAKLGVCGLERLQVSSGLAGCLSVRVVQHYPLIESDRASHVDALEQRCLFQQIMRGTRIPGCAHA